MGGSHIHLGPVAEFVLSIAAGLCLIAAPGCSSTPKASSTGGKSVSGTDEQIFIGDSIEKNYDPNVIMKRGEAFFEKEEYAEALVEYQHFLELHRVHILAPYAQYRLGETHFKMAKSIDRDPEPIRKAIASYEKLRKDFPGSRYDGQAVKNLQDCHDWLAQMHLFVGQFYYRRGSFLAAAHRFEQIIKQYPDKSVAPDALYFLAMTYKEMGAQDWADDHLILLAEKYPASQYASDGQKLLAKRSGGKPAATLTAKADEIPRNDASRSTQLPNNVSSPIQSLFPDQPSASLNVPSANSLSQSFIPCRLGAWC
jgi:outer membrane protein assembly factor BamD